MNWLNWWVPLFTLFAIAAVLPPWAYFVSDYTSGLPVVVQFFANLVLPTMAGLFVVSWVDPGGAS